MARLVIPSPLCPEHGLAIKRSECRECNAAYMRTYLWRRRQEEPDKELWRRAKKRADRRGIDFSLPEAALIIPPRCPVLGIPLRTGAKRSANSPSLDRIQPQLGYIPGNVRIISDQANRLKSNRSIVELRACHAHSTEPLRSQCQLLIEYVERESLLWEVRMKVESQRAGWKEWKKVHDFLEKVFGRGELVDH